MAEMQIDFDDTNSIHTLLGIHKINLKQIAIKTGVRLGFRGFRVSISGPRAGAVLARLTLKQLYELVSQGYSINETDVDLAVRILSANPMLKLKDIYQDQFCLSTNKLSIIPKTLKQKTYIDAINSNNIVFGIGPAGTGKTYLAIAKAIDWLLKGKVHRIVLVRSAVEAGEKKLGFLPGDLADKVNPYLRPIYDILYDMVGFEKVIKLINRGGIEAVPLAFMRGRTLNFFFIVLDEAQNTTSDQMKIFLTRLGLNSWMIINGDITQIDLPLDICSGLIEASQIFSDVKGIAIVEFTEADIVRHGLVREIIKIYKRKATLA